MRISDWSSDVCSSDLLGSIAFMGTHLVDEGYAAQLESLGSDSGQTLWGVKSDRSAPSNRRSGAGHHGTTITRFSQVMASASDTDRQQVCQNSASSPARPSSPKRLRRWKAKTSCRPASQACQRRTVWRSDEHTSELKSLISTPYG